MQKLNEIRKAVRTKRPLIHCITNPISINLCANGILAAGARPIMAEHPAEVREITASADALMLNLGSITDARMQSMRVSLQAANEKGIPAVRDAVGAACSGLRRDFIFQLLETAVPAVIKGNYSEIYALHHAAYHAAGVDADAALAADAVCAAAAALAGKYRTVILASGETDIITDGERVVRIKSGTPQLCTVTGTGCLLGALCAVYLTACTGLDAAAAASSDLGRCGRRAETPDGSGAFQARLLDALSTLTEAQPGAETEAEEIQIETL